MSDKRKKKKPGESEEPNILIPDPPVPNRAHTEMSKESDAKTTKK